MKLQPNEQFLIGKWLTDDRQAREDATCGRIRWLTSCHLRKITISKKWGAWETLFQDPDDGRYWEQTYPQSGMHGGGPPALYCLSREEAKAKYGMRFYEAYDAARCVSSASQPPATVSRRQPTSSIVEISPFHSLRGFEVKSRGGATV